MFVQSYSSLEVFETSHWQNWKFRWNL